MFHFGVTLPAPPSLHRVEACDAWQRDVTVEKGDSRETRKVFSQVSRASLPLIRRQEQADLAYYRSLDSLKARIVVNEIKAFVGHSFTPDDATVVREFLKYFDQIHSLYPGFSWEHAEAAKPFELSDKVLSQITGKNAFIGICTKKECVVANTSLSPLILRPDYRKAKVTDFSWKTSDWIIQEIGLAIGRGLKIILLVEEGLRLPGGLQGNVEYIEFNRSTPTNAFGKILEMLEALSPKVTQPGATTSDTPPKEQDVPQPSPGEGVDWTNPQPNWSFEDYRNAMFRSILLGKTEDAARIESSYLTSEDAKSGNRKAEWEANSEYVRLWSGKGGDFEKLKKIANENPDNRDIQFYLARAHAILEEYEEAARIFEASARLARDNADKQDLLGYAAINRAEAGQVTTATSIADKLRVAVIADPKIERDVLGTLRRIAEIQKDEGATIAVMERIVEVTPADFGVRFSLAYKHSEVGNNDLALYHYLRIPYEERNPTTWNNLGVSFDHFDMPAKSVDCYRKSEEQGETLAMSNLGNKLMRAGFLAEAQDELNKALAIKDYHRNVGDGLARLKDIPDQEDKKKQEILEGVKRKAEFYRLVGRAISQPPTSLGGRWRGPNCEFVVSVSANKIRAIGNYERDANALLSALSPAQKLTTKYRMEYEGTLSGRQIEGEVRLRWEGGGRAATSLLGGNDTKSKFLIVVCEDNSLKVMENPQSSSPTFYEMKII